MEQIPKAELLTNDNLVEFLLDSPTIQEEIFGKIVKKGFEFYPMTTDQVEKVLEKMGKKIDSLDNKSFLQLIGKLEKYWDKDSQAYLYREVKGNK